MLTRKESIMGENHLKKEISFFAAFATVMGTVIGAGVFFKVTTVAEFAQSPLISLLAWLSGGLITVFAGLTCAELATAIPKTGGAIKYIEYTYGKFWGFLLGWAQTVIYFPANIAALGIIFSTQFIHLFQLPKMWLIPLTLLVCCSVTVINLLGTKVAATFQSWSLILKLIPIILIVLVGLIRGSDGVSAVFVLGTAEKSSFLAKFAPALFATLFAYDGWLAVGNLAGEMKHPEKILPKAIFLGLTFITLVYVLINLTFLVTVPFNSIPGNLNTASDAATRIFGGFGGRLVTIGILISVYGALNGYTMTGLRIPYALAEEDLLPFSSWIRRLSRRTNTPYVAAFVQLAISMMMVLLGSFDLLTDMLVFVMWLFSVLIFLAVFILRKREPELKRPYRVPFYPVVPCLAILGGLFILLTTVLTNPKLALMGIGLTAMGIPVYGFKMLQKRRVKDALFKQRKN